MEISPQDVMLVTGATGLVGSHVAERARAEGIRVRALVRPASDTRLLEQWGVELVRGDLLEPAALERAVAGATIIVHCAAKVGDWGPVAEYRTVNVDSLEQLLNSALAAGTLRRFVHISSLGVYEGRDHHGTDETEEPSTRGIDGYTLTKVEAEKLVLRYVAERNLPATVLRPGFIYGPRDRTVLPRLLDKLKTEKFAFLGKGDKLMNNTFVGNLVDAVFAAIAHDESVGRVYNIHDGKLVTKREFITRAATLAEYPVPTRSVPLPVARVLARAMEGTWKLLGKKEAPLLSNARYKFLGLNLDYSIDRAKRELEYRPRVGFDDAMQQTIDWFRAQNLL